MEFDGVDEATMEVLEAVLSTEFSNVQDTAEATLEFTYNGDRVYRLHVERIV